MALALFFCSYNFCRVHRTLKTPRAVAVGLTNHVWSFRELLDRLLVPGPLMKFNQRNWTPARRRHPMAATRESGKDMNEARLEKRLKLAELIGKYFAIFSTIVVGIFGLYQYFETRR